MSQSDTFWKLFWIVVGILTILFCTIVFGLIYFYNPTKTADAAAVGVVFDAARDPFASQRPSDTRPDFSGEYLYQDTLQLAFADWSWGVRVDWDSPDVAYEGLDSFKVNFLQDWSGVRVNARKIDLSQYRGISLAIYPRPGVDDLYIELFDSSGNSLGKQSLAWYAESKALAPNHWNVVQIPFENLFPEGQSKRPITGYAISTIHPGIAYIDSVHLESDVPGHSKWFEPKPVEAPVEKPDPPISLPYSLSIDPHVKDEWKTVFGKFEPTPNGVRVGTIPEKTTGSMSYIRGGQNWTDYRIDTTTYWGQTSSFSILLRYKDDANFTSCAFSNYNAVVQLYQVKNGVSSELGASPGLAIREYEPWKNARAGASVQGNRVSCTVDGEQVLSYEVPGIASQGGAGIETWTRNTYDSPHTLQKFEVRAL